MFSNAERQFLLTGRTLSGDEPTPKKRSMLRSNIRAKTREALEGLSLALQSTYYQDAGLLTLEIENLLKGKLAVVDPPDEPLDLTNEPGF